MIIDTSAIIALAYAETRASDVFDALAASEFNRILAANFFELWAVVDRRESSQADRLVSESMLRFDILVEPVTHENALIARMAWNTY